MPAVRAQCMWEMCGGDGDRYTFFVLSNGAHRRVLTMLLREDTFCCARLHPNYAFAAVDGTLWAQEIRAMSARSPVTTWATWGGLDAQQRTWSVRVIPRQRRWELHITIGGLIPSVRDYRTHEQATTAAEEFLTDMSAWSLEDRLAGVQPEEGFLS